MMEGLLKGRPDSFFGNRNQVSKESDDEPKIDRVSTGGGEENGPVTPADKQNEVDDSMKRKPGESTEDWIKRLNREHGNK